MLHDIGKIGIHESIIEKRSPLTDEERTTIKKHPGIGEDILKPVSIDKEMLAAVRSHHERYDGKGYPDGIKGLDIPLGARIISLADSYNAMRTNRPYRGALDKNTAINNIKEMAGKQFDPKLAKSFIRLLNKNSLI